MSYTNVKIQILDHGMWLTISTIINNPTLIEFMTQAVANMYKKQARAVNLENDLLALKNPS